MHFMYVYMEHNAFRDGSKGRSRESGSPYGNSASELKTVHVTSDFYKEKCCTSLDLYDIMISCYSPAFFAECYISLHAYLFYFKQISENVPQYIPFIISET